MSDPIGHPIDDVNATRVPGLDHPDLAGGSRDGTDAVGPTTPWEYEMAARIQDAQQADERERVVAERARQMATQLGGARLANGDPHNAPHFLLVAPQGPEVCGQCGEPFPCQAYLDSNPASSPVVADRVYDDFAPSASGELLAAVTPDQLRAAAAELGVSPDRLTQALNRPTD